MEVDLDPGDFVLDGDPAPLLKKGAEPPPIFGPCLLWPNGWMKWIKMALGMEVGLGPLIAPFVSGVAGLSVSSSSKADTLNI